MPIAIRKISHARVFVSDAAWPRALSFYEGLLGLSVRHVDDQGGVAVFDCGDVTLIVERVTPEDVEDLPLVGRFTGLSFEVRDVAGAYADLSAAGATFNGQPEKANWGGTIVNIRDPSDNVFSLVDDPTRP